MGDFKVNMDKMEEIVTKLKTIQADMDNSYDKMSMLMTTIETEKEWTSTKRISCFYEINADVS